MNLFFSSYKEFKKLVFFIFLWLFLNIILNHQGFNVKETFINPFIVIIFTFILMYILNRLYLIIIKYEDNIKKYYNRILILFFIYLCITQFIFNFFLENGEPYNDFGMIRIAASEIYYNGVVTTVNDYFYIYPYQRMLPVLLALFYKITHIFGFNINTSSVLLAVINVNLAIFLMLMLLKNTIGYKAVIMGVIITALFIPFYYSPVYYYSDTMSILYPIALLYIAYSFIENKYKNYIKYAVLTGIVLFIGSSIKFTVIIIFISIIIFLFISIFTNKEYKKNILIYILISIISFSFLNIMVNVLFTSFAAKNILFAENKNNIESLPKMYWIAMGSNDIRLGAWNAEDAKNIASAKVSKDEKNRMAVDTFIYRLQKYGLQGYIKFVTDKLTWMFGDGSFFLPLAIASSINKNKKDNFLSNTFVYDSVNYSYMIYFAQAVWVIILYLILKSFFMNIYSQTIKIDDIILVATVGLLIFFTFWESRSRYIFNYTPVFIYTAVLGFTRYYNKSMIERD